MYDGECVMKIIFACFLFLALLIVAFDSKYCQSSLQRVQCDDAPVCYDIKPQLEYNDNAMDTLEVRYVTLINDFAIVRQTTPTSLIARMKSWLVESEQFDDYWENDAPPPGVAYVHSENAMTEDNHLLFLSHAIKGMRIILHDGDIKDTVLRPSHFVLLNAGVVQKGPFRAAQDCYEYIDMNITGIVT